MNVSKNNSQRFDIVILGAGMAGIPAVQKCLDLGAKTAIVIGNLLGGTCLNVGCIPTKAIWQADHMKTEIEKSIKFGYKIINNSNNGSSKNNNKSRKDDDVVDFRSVMEYQAKIVNGLMGLKTDKIREWGAEVIESTALLKSKNKIITKDGKTLETDKIFIATGSKYEIPNVEGIEYAIDGDQVLKLRELPNEKRVFIIGAGFGGLEYATFFAPFAKSIYLSTRKSELFSQDKDASSLLEKKMMNEQGITILYKDKVKKIEKAAAIRRNSSHKSIGNNNSLLKNQTDEINSSSNKLTLENPLIVHHKALNGAIQKTEVDLVLYMTKRIPNIYDLNLDAIGLKYNSLGIQVNEYLQTNIPNIYAGGDVTDTTKKLTTVANLDGEYAATNMVNGNTKKRQDLNLAVMVMYTEPPIAHVGIMEEEAKKKKIQYSKLKTPYNQFPRGIMNGNWSEEDGFIKALFEKDTGKLLGGLIYGEDADNLIHIIMLAMRASFTSYDLGELPFFHPSLGEGIRYTSLH